MNTNDRLLRQVNEGFRPMQKVLPFQLFLIPLVALIAGIALVGQFFVAGLALAGVGFVMLVPLLIVSLNRIHAYEKEYLEGLDKDSLLALVGKDMRYESRISSSLVLQTLDRRFPGWRTTQGSKRG